MRIRLEVLGGPLDGHLFQFNKTVQIGREGGDVALAVDRFVSRQHAMLDLQPPKVFLEDLKSTNGTFVNDQRLHGRVELRNGQQFRVGKTWLQIEW